MLEWIVGGILTFFAYRVGKHVEGNRCLETKAYLQDELANGCNNCLFRKDD